MMEELLRVVLHSFFLSRISHKGEFYLERFLMRQHCTNNSFCYCLSLMCSVFSVLSSDLS